MAENRGQPRGQRRRQPRAQFRDDPEFTPWGSELADPMASGRATPVAPELVALGQLGGARAAGALANRVDARRAAQEARELLDARRELKKMFYSKTPRPSGRGSLASREDRARIAAQHDKINRLISRAKNRRTIDDKALPQTIVSTGGGLISERLNAPAMRGNETDSSSGSFDGRYPNRRLPVDAERASRKKGGVAKKASRANAAAKPKPKRAAPKKRVTSTKRK